MPTLKKIVVQDFRNIAFQELSFSPNVNCISGNNGEGKTNLLDAIYYLSMTKSAFPAPDRYNWRFGTDGFTIGGTYLMDNGLESRFSIRVGEGEKKLVRDEKPCTRISEHIGVLPVVMVSPSDIALVSESGEERRRFVNGVLSQMDRSYLAAVQTYNRLLAQRNKMLKDGNVDWDLMDVFDTRMAAAAQPAFEARKRFAEELRPVIQSYYKLISGGSEEVSVEYRSDLAKAPLEELLRAGRERDQVLRFTGSGIQRDDFLFSLDGHPIRRCGSQGQQKSFLVSLKFAQYEIMRDGYGYAPILLLDDVFDKLDMNRIGNLIGMVAGSGFGQIFITDCNKVRSRTTAPISTRLAASSRRLSNGRAQEKELFRPPERGAYDGGGDRGIHQVREDSLRTQYAADFRGLGRVLRRGPLHAETLFPQRDPLHHPQFLRHPQPALFPESGAHREDERHAGRGPALHGRQPDGRPDPGTGSQIKKSRGPYGITTL